MESFRTFQVPAVHAASVAVDVKHRIWGDGRIRVDEVRTKVLRDAGGWYLVEGIHSGEGARVLYRDMQDLILVSWPNVYLRIAFRKGEGQFRWEDRPYHIASMIDGDIRIDQGGRVVVRGHVTVAGIHLETVAVELLPIVRPLAWGLALRSERVGRDSRFEPPTAVATAP